jgi:hypothetical protein
MSQRPSALGLLAAFTSTVLMWSLCFNHSEPGGSEYIDWFNHRRVHGEIGLVPPAEHEESHYRHNTAPTTVGASVASLH